MRSCPPEDDEDWGLCSDLDDSEEEVGLRQAGGPLRCWQRAGFKRLTIDERRPPAVLPARYSVSACCAVCGRRPGAGHPLAPLFDDTSFVSMADVVKDVVGLEFSVSTNPHENVMCGDCRGHLLALHTMRGWLAALQRQFVRMVVCTNSGRRSAKILVPKAYRGVDFFSREAPFLELLESSGRTVDAVTRTEPGRQRAGEAGTVGESEDTSGVVSGADSERVTRTDQRITECGVDDSEQCQTGAAQPSVTSSDAVGDGETQNLLDDAPPVVGETVTVVESGQSSDMAVDEAHQKEVPSALRPQPLHQPEELTGSPQQQQSPSFRPSEPPLHLSLPQSASDLHQPPSSLHRAALTQPPEPPQSAPAAPSTPPRPAATGADATDPAGLLDPFEEYSISDLLVLRSPLAARPPAAPEGPPPAKLKKIAPKIDRRDLPPQPPPIVLNIMAVSAPVQATPNFKAIVPRRPEDDSHHPRAVAGAPTEPGRRSQRRLAATARDSRRQRRALDVGPAPPALPSQQQHQQHQQHHHQHHHQQQQQPQHERHRDPAGYPEPMVFFNPDGSIPAPPYSAQVEAETAGMAAAGEYTQLQTVPPEQPPPPPPPPPPEQAAPPPSEYRHSGAFAVSHSEMGCYDADYTIYLDQGVPEEHDSTHQRQETAQERPGREHSSAAPQAAAVERSSASDTHQVSLKNSSESDSLYREVPRICKPCGVPISYEMIQVRKHLVEFHMSLERNDLTGSTLYRCRACPAKSTSLESLRKHFSTTHVRAAAVACGRCEQLFSNLEAVQHHIRRKHPRRTECPECGLSFLTARSLLIHRTKTHQTKESPAAHRQSPPPPSLPPVADEVTIGTSG
ncbi:arginine-glutamic acid dipeptide repeats protein-like isoform X1 [Amphibalanus amphitrite]|uniref:arginine-glutamic acid dipeptide repeats protein-like isoform X1 n=1 Tax=Amphibalanus amphitrite TaxID=1232801 RepID=UPI001C91FB98|nr:arginine-glutamic acid dipeptide repeats protein-like isoform X1 [Amphibalanus amphitrite]XP_043196034.1 arginine-glutamic acid dipeptide repeats protein-like isoform X1 [Amphibalanus amphitrite]XP_043196035.1 arginine-glutamic acid dipeptide repeats protein-like isoform X1 [Amphibalanus amphitrite]XP_043196036.1 arginine-glutamic acid dipeptide repeats protein-like isoform X1 [Amphibalanus amphitrite]